MAHIKKLSTFRQLSLNCETPSTDQRRKSFKKQFSEDIPDTTDKLLEANRIKISQNNKIRNSDHPPPIKIAWADNSLELKRDEGVIVKKYTEIKRPSTTTKSTRRNSIEKDSILYSKQELADRLRSGLVEKPQEKPNLNIFLAHNTRDDDNDESCSIYSESILEMNSKTPKIMQPLFIADNNNKNVFQIRKNSKSKINLNDICYSPTVPPNEKTTRSDAILVVPVIEKDIKDVQSKFIENQSNFQTNNFEQLIEDRNCDPKPINNVIIRPVTAATKRERFQKRTNSAFNSTIRETNSRPPLIRSSSAPSKPDQSKPKFLSTKRKIKQSKRKESKCVPSEDEDNSNKENPKNQRELNRYVPINGVDIVTMVSLVSPAASDNEDLIEIENDKPKCKTANNSPNKNSQLKKNEKDVQQATMSLRKVVKSVSFQQSSIHAIRSFSASFPARRSSMAMLDNNLKGSNNSQKINEKRSTNTNSPDNERFAKRRLVRNSTGTSVLKSFEEPDLRENHAQNFVENDNLTIDLKREIISEDLSDTTTEDNLEKVTTNLGENAENTDGEHKFTSSKEKECWNMYCKMTDKGISVSYETLLRGLLTPTEYRMRRKDNNCS